MHLIKIKESSTQLELFRIDKRVKSKLNNNIKGYLEFKNV